MLPSILISISLFVFVVIYRRNKANRHRLIQKEGLKIVGLIKQLISTVQQHRGLSSAWLNGDETKFAALNQKKKEVATLRKELEMNGVNSANSRWHSFEDHWSRLLKTANKADTDNNFRQHTHMISNLLYLLEDEAERALLNATSLPSMPCIGYVWRELVVATEIVGQSRAIGTGVATNRFCSSVDKVRLSFLEQHIKESSHKILPELPKLNQHAADIQSLVNTAMQDLQALTGTITNELVEADKVKIDQNSYFSMATKAITSLDNIFNKQLEQVNSTL